MTTLGATLSSCTGTDLIKKSASMYPLIKYIYGTDSVKVKPLLTISGTFNKIYYHQVKSFGNSADRLFWPALTSSGAGTFVADALTFNNVLFNDIQCYSC